MPLLRGHPVEGCWLCMVGAGLRREEALALTWRDVRRVEVGGRMVVQLAVWRARTWEDGTRATKTARSRRVAAVAEPFATRLWELRGDPDELVCALGAGNMARTWRRLWGEGRPLAPLPYLPLSRMRATHETMMQAAGVPDSVNAAAHGHSVAVAYGHYMRPDSASAAGDVGDMLAGRIGRKQAIENDDLGGSGGPSGIRTLDLGIKSPARRVLYAPDLRICTHAPFPCKSAPHPKAGGACAALAV